MEVFANRREAGRALAERLGEFLGLDVVVLGLPRGGVPVAAEVARALGAPLDVICVRKLGVPRQPELAMGAIGEGGFTVRDEGVLAMTRVSPDEFDRVERTERIHLAATVSRLRSGRTREDLTAKVAIIVDDGMATGSTARAACAVARHLGAGHIVLAVPVAPAGVVTDFPDADRVVVVHAPNDFSAVGMHYRDFRPTSDEEVARALDEAARRRPAGVAPGAGADVDSEVTIGVGPVNLAGHLHLPTPATAVVIFAHGSGSSRWSPRNRFVADVLFEAGLGTLVMDLLAPREEDDRRLVFDVDLLATRLLAATHWLRSRPGTERAAVGFFGASTGAGAALVAAAREPAAVSAVVSRGGRPDLAGPRLDDVRAPTLLIVGGDDTAVLELNRDALVRLQDRGSLAVVPGATHLFEEPGTLEHAARLARDFLVAHLLPSSTEG
jgi:putative phosphoribosyl transferase